MKILVIYDFKVTLKIVRNYLMTECEKVGVVETCSSPVQAVVLLATEKFDLVFSGLEMAGASGLFIHAQMVKAGVNKDTAFVIMTSNNNEYQHQRLLAHGIQHVLPLPFKPEQLRELIDNVCNPRQFRTFKRYSIPQTLATLCIGQAQLTAKVFNISLNGILCELNLPREDKAINLLAVVTLSVKFPPDYESIGVNDIAVSPVRINVHAWHQDQHPQTIVCAWRFVDIATASSQTLARVFEKAEHDFSGADVMRDQ